MHGRIYTLAVWLPGALNGGSTVLDSQLITVAMTLNLELHVPPAEYLADEAQTAPARNHRGRRKM